MRTRELKITVNLTFIKVHLAVTYLAIAYFILRYLAFSLKIHLLNTPKLSIICWSK